MRFQTAAIIALLASAPAAGAHDARRDGAQRLVVGSGEERVVLGERPQVPAGADQRVARGEAPQNVDGSDFAYGTVQLGYGFKQLRKDRRGEFSLTADIGQSYYGGEEYNSYFRTSIGQSYYLDPQNLYWQ